MQKIGLGIGLLVIVTFACNDNYSNEKTIKDCKHVKDKLSLEFGNNFSFRAYDDSLWNMADKQACLLEVVLDSSAQVDMRFNAAEILFHKKALKPDQTNAEKLAKIYAQILSDNKYEGHLWGLPRPYAGPTTEAEHLISVGESMIAALVPLLDNEERIRFSGSRVATEALWYKYRVKDYAAYFICNIINMPYNNTTDVAERDRHIEALKKQLKRD